MKLFGRHLVDMGLISEEKLLAALVTQLESQASVAKIVYDKNLLSPREQLLVLERQSISGVEYRRACIELGLWTGAVESVVRRQLSSNSTPIGQILVRAGVLELESLSKALDDFIAKGLGATDRTRIEHCAAPCAKSSNPSIKPHGTLVRRYLAFFDEDKRYALSLMDRPSRLATVDKLARMARLADLGDAVAIWERLAALLHDSAAPGAIETALEEAWAQRVQALTAENYAA